MKSAYDILKERGFIEQVTDETLIKEMFAAGPVTCYIGFDPTATSLHIGSLVPIMSLAHMQRSGNKPIALVGGGTGLIGDPSGKTEMRQVLTRDQIDYNAQCLKEQLSKYLDFSDNKALLLNNADWLTKLNYIDFLRDIGRHFSVNRMLAAESYKIRMEKGLNFIEFNYMVLQGYDFLYLPGSHDTGLLFRHHPFAQCNFNLCGSSGYQPLPDLVYNRYRLFVPGMYNGLNGHDLAHGPNFISFDVRTGRAGF